ncbi:MAG: TRAP transporter small permease subunit [Parvularculaceae bacterium]|nr:TRAP transporter small permease subunit [Parvularculaceae bacterium]
MLTVFGDILNWLAAGVLFPLLALPLASLGKTRRAAAAIWFALIGAIIGGAMAFANLAVDLAAPKWTPALALAVIGGVGVCGAFVLVAGADALAARLASVFSGIVTRIGRLSLHLVILMAGVQFAIVILRYVFGVNFIAMQESVTYMHGGVFLLAGGYALLTDDHVRVDIFYREARPRRKALVDLAGTYLFLFPFCLIALWAAGPYVANSWFVREGSMEQSGIKGVFLLKTLIPVYLTLLALAGFVIAARAAETLKTRSG